MPEINDSEVLIKVILSGVCASELECWLKGDGGEKGIRGHEAVGIIDKVGKNVICFKPGDRVTGLFGNAFAEYTIADFKNIVKVPDGLMDIEALGEPVACLVSGAERTAVSLGDTVSVVGLGFMGLGFMQLLALKGAAKVIGVDVRQDSLRAALRLGADEAYLPEQVDEKYIVTDWAHIGRGVDVSCDASGKQKGLELAGNMTAVHGVLSIVGWHQYGPRTINMELWNWKGISIVNAHERRYDFLLKCMKRGLDLIKAGRLNIRDMITHEFSLDEVDKAYAALKDKPEGFIKAIVRV